MATPTLDLVCCLVRNLSVPATVSPRTGKAVHQDDEKVTFLLTFNICAILSSCLSILGAVYILLPKKSYLYVQRQRRSFRAVERQKKILTWLSVADVLACLGVLIIAICGLADVGSITVDISESASLRWICIVTTAWIQYFYVATYFWTFFYALDVHLMLRGNNRKMFRVYLVLAWLVPAIMVSAGLIAMYQSSPNDFQCDPAFKSWQSLLPHYLMSYIPMLIVLVFNPVMYLFSAKKVGPLLMRGNMFTDRERAIQSQVQRKFFRFVLVFTLCWLPNVINGCILLHSLAIGQTNWHTYSTFTAVIWVAMAIMNPLQAFLNALIYWGPRGCTPNTPSQFELDNNAYDRTFLSNNHPDQAPNDSAEENAPLMGGTRRLTNRTS
ncbi:G-protein coupled receptor 143-like [Patiria miniata]|uniref:G-protein coupled receptors family 2 profile 2 domain-containing protein n=1 Tax=Patiria miniata TaxID=46514 RepID=A0A914BG91_PATMI|nr:G-protein coupled receptor 143-like [Patiria miniata]XP_038075278.1 G-protein coupled receptor 143-like [Patiria miniata]